jgi:hypothetical protein
MKCLREIVPIWALSVAVLSSGCSRQDKTLIVPGKSVGPYRLHQPRSQIHGGDIDVYTHPAAKGLLLSFKDESVSVISVFTPNYRTREGLCLGSLESEVLAAFGEPEKKSTNDSNEFWDYKSRGLQIGCKDGKVILINVLDNWNF